MIAQVFFAGFDWSSFFNDFWPNLAATVIGVALGLPIALWTNRKLLAHEKRAEATEARARYRAGLEALRTVVGSNTYESELLVGTLRGELAEEGFAIDPKLDSTAWEANRLDVAPMLHDPVLHGRLARYFERVGLAKRLGEPLMLHSLESEVATQELAKKEAMLRKGLAILIDDISSEGKQLDEMLRNKLDSLPA